MITLQEGNASRGGEYRRLTHTVKAQELGIVLSMITLQYTREMHINLSMITETKNHNTRVV
jgi:hypothetical protein